MAIRPSLPTEPPPAPKVLQLEAYPWLAGGKAFPKPTQHLDDRFAPPEGFKRIALGEGSFGAWLRRLPVASADSPVLTYRGAVLLDSGHRNLAAVVSIDIGAADLQQCADSVMRMHAEWMWSRGSRDMSYRAASGLTLPYARWAAGERVVAEGSSLRWIARSRASQDYGSFRSYLDTVFAWANTVSLERQAKAVAVHDAQPGDFVVLPGNPGHAVLILDMAEDASGTKVVLLGQGYMPAQSFHVLRPDGRGPWFRLDPDAPGIKTPFWPIFPWASLRRLQP